jgi:hypothetical protein
MKKLIYLSLPLIWFTNCNTEESDFLPPQLYEEKIINRSIDDFHIITDLDEGVQLATISDKPILLCFTGYSVINARKIEENLLISNESVYRALKDDYINIWLYVDDKTNEKDWTKYQMDTFGTSHQPFFIILDSKGNPISQGMDYLEANQRLEITLEKHK